MKLKKYKLGELIDVTRGASLSGEFYATEGEYVRLTCGNFDYRNNCFKENKSKDNIYYVGNFREEFLMEEPIGETSRAGTCALNDYLFLATA